MSNLENMPNSSSYEQKKNNGKGIFYGVIAVATLIVAIIGATFAYFTAQANSTNGALSATAATVSINYTEGRTIQATNLVPASATVVAQAYHNPTAEEYNTSHSLTCTGENPSTNCKKVGDVGTKCVDDNGYFVCAWYEFSVTNESNISQAITAQMTINQNEFTALDQASLIKNGAKANAKGDYTGASRAIYSSSVTGEGTEGTNDLALKFMTIRSADTVDVNATVCSTQKTDTTVMTTDFCGSDESTSDTPFTTSLSGITVAEQNSSTTNALYTDNATGRKYYAYNTTAVRQSMEQAGQNQVVFAQEIIPTAPTDPSTGKVLETCDANGTVGAGTSKCGTARTFYVLVWLEENRYVGTTTCSDGSTKDAQDCDQGKSYKATITVQAIGSGNDNNSGYVTGTMKPTPTPTP